MAEPIYLDYNATTPIDPRVAEAMMPFLRGTFGNPGSTHPFGMAARAAVARARKQVADLLGCDPEEIVFTSGGSESNNHAIVGAALSREERGRHIITSAVEHPAVMEVCRHLEGRGFRLTILPVDETGLVSPGDLEKAITSETILVTIMHANNEVGTIQPIREIAEVLRNKDILLHSDCAQTVGKIPVRVDDLQVDLLSIAGHKLYAPKGVGALYIRTGVDIPRLVHGADHEMGRRAGTENVLSVVGLGEACAMVQEHLDDHAAHLRSMRDLLEGGLEDRIETIRVNGHREKRIPNTLSVSFPGLEAETILSELTGVAASPGAACHSEDVTLSPTLEAMGIPVDIAMGTVRLSVGRYTTEDEIHRAIDEITSVVGRLQGSEVTETTDVRLTRFTHGLGCACKLRPQLLEKVLQSMPSPEDERVLVGTDTSDDAAVYRIDDRRAIVQTVDFFTPIVDDPFSFGAIAAANSLSDIYAMGAEPLFALNVVGFPSHRLPVSVLQTILEGAQAKAREAGIPILGGHTVDDTEPKFGLAVTGIVDVDHLVTNRGAVPGDVLVLTKPIGTGILSTALKRGILDEETARLLTETMAALNRMDLRGAHACTDVTGFGLLGHLLEMMKGSGTSAVIRSGEVPLLPGAADLARSGIVPGGTKDNRSFVEPSVEYGPKVTETRKVLLNDAQTSGGLLIALSRDRAEGMGAIIGEVVSCPDVTIVVRE